MVFSFIKQKKQIQGRLNAAEAFNIWNMSKTYYTTLERLQVWNNFIHDKDFLVLTSKYESSVKKIIQDLENEMRRYGIKGPSSQAIKVRTARNSDIIRDQLIAHDALTCVQEEIEMLLDAIRTAIQDDRLRQLFVKFSSRAIGHLDTFIKYIKLKGWIGVPPLYEGSIQNKLDAGEAFNLWAHLTYRYDNINLTEIFLSLANDGDFILFLKQGMRVLTRQKDILEKELQHLSLTLPVAPPSVTPEIVKSQVFNDDSMFRNIFGGITGALSVHARVLKQTTTNDRLRKVFSNILQEEIEYFDLVVRFGKYKGWLNPGPSFSVIKPPE